MKRLSPMLDDVIGKKAADAAREKLAARIVKEAGEAIGIDTTGVVLELHGPPARMDGSAW